MSQQSSQFQPGQSGNPGGRPKWKPFSDAYRELGKLKPSQLRAYAPKTQFEAVAKARLLAASVKGGYRDAQEAADRTEGKVPAETKIDATVREAPKPSTLAEILNLIAAAEAERGK